MALAVGTKVRISEREAMFTDRVGQVGIIEDNNNGSSLYQYMIRFGADAGDLEMFSENELEVVE